MAPTGLRNRRMCARARHQSLLPTQSATARRAHEDQADRVRLRHEGRFRVVPLRFVGISRQLSGRLYRDAGRLSRVRAVGTQARSVSDLLSAASTALMIMTARWKRIAEYWPPF